MSPLSIYVHWPFCLSLCPYCDFNSHIAATIDQLKWLKAYKQELDFFVDKIKGRPIKSIFFGGGTPSLMAPLLIEGIINHISLFGEISKETEITLEANPTSFEINKFKAFKTAGINRVSIGVQSFIEEDLKILGRKHSSTEAISAIKSASKIFPRYSFDLIYARPRQTLAAWQEEMKIAVDLADGHISLYQLTIEKGTLFFKMFNKDKTHSLPSNNLAANMYEWTNDYLESNDYQRYEISNYAKKTQECLHNLCYWNYNEYLGIGPGAHSRLHYYFKNNNQVPEIQSIMMLHKPEKWLESVFEKNNGIQNIVKLSRQEIIEEVMMMGTRIEYGLDERNFYQLTGLNFCDVLNEKIIEHYIKQNLVTMQNQKLTLTSNGLLLHNYLVPRMLKN